MENVAGPCIDAALPRVPSSQRHYRALPYCEVGAALVAVDSSPVTQVVSLCLRFVVLTAARGVEARNSQWSEIDIAKKKWRIPAERMKARREHRVPLSSASLAVLEKAHSLKDESELIFPSPRKRGQPLSNMSLLKALRDTGFAEKVTVHGFRSSFRDWCAEKGKSRALANAALAHTVAGVEGAYFRSDLCKEPAKPDRQTPCKDTSQTPKRLTSAAVRRDSYNCAPSQSDRPCVLRVRQWSACKCALSPAARPWP